MYSEKLYELAFAYRKTKLWKSLYDSELFAVTLENGQIGYCVVMGYLGEHIALALYIGDKGLANYRALQDMHREDVNMLKEHEFMLSQNCLQCVFASKDELFPQELDGVRAYAASHRLTLRGAKAFPQFISYRQAQYPWPVTEENEERQLIEVLEAALEVSRQVNASGKESLGFAQGPVFDRAIPLLARTADGFVWSSHPLPPRQPPRYPEPALQDELLTARLKKQKKNGECWLCDVVMLPMPASEEEGMRPVFPYFLLAADGDGMLLKTDIVPSYEEEVESILQSLGKQMLERGLPRQIVVVDQRTLSLLKHLTETLKIKLTLQEDNEELDDIEEDLMAQYSGMRDGEEGLSFLPKLLEELDDEMLLSMPGELWDSLLEMDSAGLLDKESSQRLAELARRRK